jgi:hypothetical protein
MFGEVKFTLIHLKRRDGWKHTEKIAWEEPYTEYIYRLDAAPPLLPGSVHAYSSHEGIVKRRFRLVKQSRHHDFRVDQISHEKWYEEV